MMALLCILQDHFATMKARNQIRLVVIIEIRRIGELSIIVGVLSWSFVVVNWHYNYSLPGQSDVNQREWRSLLQDGFVPCQSGSQSFLKLHNRLVSECR